MRILLHLPRIILSYTLLFIVSYGLTAQEVDHYETVFFNNTIYRYRTNNDDKTTNNWRDPDFDASEWRSVYGGIGYGDSDDNTTILKSISVFMRTSFEIIDTSVIASALLHADYDDAFVAYLNGVEIARSAGLTDPFPADTILSAVNHEATMYSGGLPEVFEVSDSLLKKLLVEGRNVMAIQVHNVTPNSSDLSSNFFFSVGMSTSDFQYNSVPDWFYVPLVFEGSTLPLMIIDTDGKTIPNEPKITATMQLINNGNGLINHPDDPPNEYDGFIGIEIRGATSAYYPQKPYALETRDSLGDNLNVPLLGMPSENDWVLLSHYNEKSFMRNPLSYHLFEEMGHYSIRSRLVDVIINGKYEGIYLFAEKVKRDKNRINIKKLTASDTAGIDLTGGYIFKTDYASSYDSWLSDYSPIDHPDYDTRFVYYYPKWDNITDEQKTYIKETVDAFQDAIRQDDFAQTYSGFIDVPSFIDYFMVSEVSRNVDGYKKSRYYHKNRDDIDGLIHAGPVWDFDWAWKNINGCKDLKNKVGAGWSYKVNDCRVTYAPGWYVRLMEDHEFEKKTYCRYKELRKTTLSLDSIYSFMDSVYNVVIGPQKNHYLRWNILGKNTGAPELDPPSKTYDEEVQKLKDWIATRIAWLDANMMGENDECGLTPVDEEKNIIFRVFPNPATRHVYIESDIMIVRTELLDISGRIVRSFNPGHNYTWKLNLSDLPGGMYFIRSYLSNGHTVVRKILKE